MNSVRLINLRLKYQRKTPSGCKDIWVTEIGVVSKTHLLCVYLYFLPGLISE